MTRRLHHHLLGAALGATVLFACHPVNDAAQTLRTSLITDSVHFTVVRQGIFFHGQIGFTLVNTTSHVFSRSGCGGPGVPELQKEVDGRWVTAYGQISGACRSVPDFSWQPGERWHAALSLWVAEQGANFHPQLYVASIDGRYRLRWTFVEGPDPDARGARTVVAVSNEFRLTLAAPP